MQGRNLGPENFDASKAMPGGSAAVRIHPI